MNLDYHDLTNEERVAQGAAWLDERVPGWEQKVDTDTLVMASNCVADEVFGTTTARGYDVLYDIAVAEHGSRGGTFLMAHSFLFGGLEEWKQLINARQEALV